MKRKILSLLLCLLLLVSLSGMCMANDYLITEEQLTQLDSNLIQLSNNNQQLLEQLSQSKQDLATASTQLATLKAQLITLQSQTNLALQQQQTAQDSLKIANEYFLTLEQTEKSKIKKLTLERDVVAVALIAKMFIK